MNVIARAEIELVYNSLRTQRVSHGNFISLSHLTVRNILRKQLKRIPSRISLLPLRFCEPSPNSEDWLILMVGQIDLVILCPEVLESRYSIVSYFTCLLRVFFLLAHDFSLKPIYDTLKILSNKYFRYERTFPLLTKHSKNSHLILIIYTCLYSFDWHIGLGNRVFANDPGDRDSIPGRVIPKTQKMALDTSLFNTQHYKVHIKGKVEQSIERSSAPHYTSVW